MAEQSRIKFNPTTKEIEVEGSEAFVKTYFEKLQSMLFGAEGVVEKPAQKPKVAKTVKEKHVKEKPAKKVRQSKKATKAAKKEVPAEKGKRGDMSKAVLALIQESPDGITTADLKAKSGLKESQIRAIVNSAKKRGLISNSKRGVYVGA